MSIIILFFYIPQINLFKIYGTKGGSQNGNLLSLDFKLKPSA